MSSNAGERRPSKAKCRPQNVSLFPLERAALRLLAGEERGNISATVAHMIDHEMTMRYGASWRTRAPLDHETRDEVQIVA